MKLLVRLGKFITRNPINSRNTTCAEEMGLPKFHGDFRPDLKQDIDIYDMFIHLYQKPTDSVRVKIPSRYNKIELNGKYIPYIHSVVANKLKEQYPEFKDEDISTIKLKVGNNLMGHDYDDKMTVILKDLAYNIYLKEHRLRYQTEQRLRFEESEKKFKSFFYLNRGKTWEQFIIDYNHFLWKEISKSHLGMSPKIENNYRRNYHDGEVSPITSIVFYLYFKTNCWSRFISRVLVSSYRNPFTNHQKKFI